MRDLFTGIEGLGPAGKTEGCLTTEGEAGYTEYINRYMMAKAFKEVHYGDRTVSVRDGAVQGPARHAFSEDIRAAAQRGAKCA